MSVYTLTDEERQWLVDLNGKLWPKEHTGTNPNIKSRISMDALRTLTWEEFKEVERLVEQRTLLTSMICTGMFGGYGMDVYEHEVAPDLGPTLLVRLVEGHMPDPHRIQIAEGYNKHIRPGGGRGRQDAWEFFSKFTHSERNAGWLASYKMRAPRDQHHYDY